MTGRGIDQILRCHSDPALHGAFSKDARSYVYDAERVSGKIEYPVDKNYLWERMGWSWRLHSTDARIINLETAITVSDDYWEGKPIHYRMHPGNVDILKAAGVTCCALANNHVRNWGYSGLEETLSTLDKAAILHAGAGENNAAAGEPAIIERRGKSGRIIVFSGSTACSGVPREWSANDKSGGINRLPDLSSRAAERIRAQIEKAKAYGNIVVYSIHWGSNWG